MLGREQGLTIPSLLVDLEVPRGLGDGMVEDVLDPLVELKFSRHLQSTPHRLVFGLIRLPTPRRTAAGSLP
jgi:hypothetical protein